MAIVAAVRAHRIVRALPSPHNMPARPALKELHMPAGTDVSAAVSQGPGQGRSLGWLRTGCDTPRATAELARNGAIPIHDPSAELLSHFT